MNLINYFGHACHHNFNTMFRKLDLLPSSGGRKGSIPLSWTIRAELVSVEEADSVSETKNLEKLMTIDTA
jgi:hypothetical protein